MRDTHAFSSLGGYQTTSYELSGLGYTGTDQCRAAYGKYVSRARRLAIDGPRLYSAGGDDRRQVAVLSYQTWHSRFHGEAHILGRKILLDRKPYEIIGVMPREFEFPLVPGQLNRSELWVPMSFTQAEMVQGAGNWGYQHGRTAEARRDSGAGPAGCCHRSAGDHAQLSPGAPQPSHSSCGAAAR